jgi:hypothetical protein
VVLTQSHWHITSGNLKELRVREYGHGHYYRRIVAEGWNDRLRVSPPGLKKSGTGTVTVIARTRSRTPDPRPQTQIPNLLTLTKKRRKAQIWGMDSGGREE